MSSTPRTQTICTMGFAAQGIGSRYGLCTVRFEFLASARAGVAATK
jgi:hypothetical protein